MDHIEINNLQVFGKHGVLKEENRLGQKFSVSARLYLDLRRAGLSDDLSLSVHYGEVCRFISDFMQEHTFKLIEKAAEELSRNILLKFVNVERVLLEIKKPWAPIGLPLDAVSVKIERARHTAYIGLGSNIGDRKAHIDNALKSLSENEDISVEAVSDLIVTKAYGYEDQDDFLNGVARVRTLLTPSELLKVLGETENSEGRERDLHWGPRTLDLDILLYDDLVVDTEDLVIPHPDMQRRRFVLEPFSQIGAYVRHPLLNRTINELLKELEGSGS